MILDPIFLGLEKLDRKNIWYKIMILYGLRHCGQHGSHHDYDVHQLMQPPAQLHRMEKRSRADDQLRLPCDMHLKETAQQRPV